MTSMLERATHAVIVVLILLLAFAVLRRRQKRKAGTATARLVPRSGKPALVYFHSASCGLCRSSQRPIVESLLAHVGPENLQVIMVDVNEQMQIARDWGVATVPSTYVVSPGGEVAHVNNGVAGERQLRQQLAPYISRV